MEKFYDGIQFPVNPNGRYYVWGNNKYELVFFSGSSWKTETFSRPSARRDYYSHGITELTTARATELICEATRMSLNGIDWLID